MARLPDRPDLGQLKRQAKDLLRLYRNAAPEALSRFRNALPAARGKDDAALTALGLKLHLPPAARTTRHSRPLA